MDTQLDQKPIRALRQRYPLLDAWLEAMDRLDGPRCKIATLRHVSTQRRPLIQSVEQRHPVGRRRLPYLVVSRQG